MTTTSAPEATPTRYLPRFDRVERVVHWTNATLFLILVLTGASLYVEQLATFVGHRHTVKTIHVYAGLLLPIPLLLGLVVPAGDHEPPPQHGIVLAVGPGIDWWESAGVEMPVKKGDHVVFPASAGVWIEVDEDGDYKILVSYKSEGRTQVVFVRSVVETYGKQRVREVWSYGYQGDKDQFSSLVANRLLDASNKVKLGSWVKQGKSAVFVVKVSAESSADELDDAIDAAGAAADEMEKELTEGKDEF